MTCTPASASVVDRALVGEGGVSSCPSRHFHKNGNTTPGISTALGTWVFTLMRERVEESAGRITQPIQVILCGATISLFHDHGSYRRPCGDGSRRRSHRP